MIIAVAVVMVVVAVIIIAGQGRTQLTLADDLANSSKVMGVVSQRSQRRALVKCAMTSTFKGALAAVNPIGPNCASALESTCFHGANVSKHESFD